MSKIEIENQTMVPTKTIINKDVQEKGGENSD